MAQKPSFAMPATGRTGGVARKSDTESRLNASTSAPETVAPVITEHPTTALDAHTGMTGAPSPTPDPDNDAAVVAANRYMKGR